MSFKKILIVEPYYGGSHKQFLEGVVGHVDACFTLLKLPARKWKMRMQLSAPWFVKKIKEMDGRDRCFDLVLCSTFIDVAVFRALISEVDGWDSRTSFHTYFHENQFVYPGHLPKSSQHQFTAINFTTALASDRIAFNSNYNRDTFCGQCRKYLSKAVDMEMVEDIDAIEKKSTILYPGMDYTHLDELNEIKGSGEIPVIIWNHRWEHDKNPEEFFEACYRLRDEAVPFRLVVLGQRFRDSPDCFSKAREELQEQILHFGYVENKQDYYRLLSQGDYVVSTAHHEFFGISVLEAVRAGCYPVLPERLSYPELYKKKYLYKEGRLFKRLKTILRDKPTRSRERSFELTERFSWESILPEYHRWLFK
jgi:glycosyltransferase involved in cell wall biosynthesis